MPPTNDNYAREREYFGFHPLSFVDDVVGAALDYCAEGVNGMEVFLKEKYASTDSEADAVADGVDRVLQELKAVLDKNMDKFELYSLRNVFSIPAKIDTGAGAHELSAEDEQTLQSYIAAEERVDAELLELRSSLRQQRLDNNELRATRAALEAHVAGVQQFAQELNLVQGALEQGSNSPFDATMAQLLQQSHMLQGMVHQMKKTVDIAQLTTAAAVQEVGGPVGASADELMQARNFIA